MSAELKEITVEKEAVLAELAKVGLNIPASAIASVSASECDGTTIVIAEIDQNMSITELNAFKSAFEAAKDDITAETVAHFVALEVDGYISRINPEDGKLRGVVSYITGEDAVEFASMMRFRRSFPSLSALADLFSEAGIDLGSLLDE